MMHVVTARAGVWGRGRVPYRKKIWCGVGRSLGVMSLAKGNVHSEKNLMWSCGEESGGVVSLTKKHLMWWCGEKCGDVSLTGEKFDVTAWGGVQGSTEKKLMFFCDSVWCMFPFYVLTGKNILNIWRGRLSPQEPFPSWLPPAVVHIHQSCCCNGQHWCWTGPFVKHPSVHLKPVFWQKYSLVFSGWNGSVKAGFWRKQWPNLEDQSTEVWSRMAIIIIIIIIKRKDNNNVSTTRNVQHATTRSLLKCAWS